MRVGGFIGRILRVNLTTGDVKTEPINWEWARKFFGGKGLAAKYLYEELSAGTDPLSPENMMIFMTGPLTGTVSPCSGKHVVVSKSPASGTFLDCYAGGYWGAELKYAGFDGVIIRGRASKPVYLWIHDGEAEIRDASHLWGKDTHETEKALKEELGKDVKVCSIGPAGENLVKFACITNDLFRQAARGGIGAVMGSKNLKAIAVEGHGGVWVPDIEKFVEVCKSVIDEDVLGREDDHGWAITDGTPIIVGLSQGTALFPTRNFQTGVFEDAEKIGSDAVKAVTVARKACFNCPLACGNITLIKEGRFAGTLVEGPEYETLALTGSNCGIGDLGAIARFNLLCDRLGIDTISAGNVVAFAMELYERGILTKEDTGGLDLRFGNVDAYIQMPELIAYKRGIGELLAEGVRTAAERIGKGAEKYALHVKGVEYPGYDPRGSYGMALAYATADRGCCHLRAWIVADEAFGDMPPYTFDGKPERVIFLENRNSVKWSLIICDFYLVDYPVMSKLVSACTGWDVSPEELKIAGERIWNLTRLFNVREGFSRKDDTVPPRITTEELPDGVAKGQKIKLEEFEAALSRYYQLRGWDENGIPTEEKLKELGLK